MAKEITVTLYLNNKPIETLTPEQSERMAKRLSEAMSLYYTANPEEFQKLKKKRK